MGPQGSSAGAKPGKGGKATIARVSSMLNKANVTVQVVEIISRTDK